MSDLEALPPLNGLRAFCAAGRHLNFRLAADSLGVTQGAVAQQVRGLEGQLGTGLFTRGARGLAFTEAGRGFHRQIEAAFLRVETATQGLRGGRARVRLSTTPELATRWLVPRMAALSAELANVDLSVTVSASPAWPGPATEMTLLDGAPPFGAGVEAVRLAQGEALAVCAPFALTTRRRRPKDAVLLHAPGTDWAALLKTSQRLPGQHFDTALAAIEAALAGDGVALAPRFLVETDLTRGRLVQPITARQVTGGDLYLLTRQPAAATAAVRDWLVSQVPLMPSAPATRPPPSRSIRTRRNTPKVGDAEVATRPSAS